ncbi:MAG: PLP-dependent aspartate aminotransferase family protein [Gammaproteobacteria bacterium]|nr:PLP-dependent aspartate aminotransferase family protein [Gammaproteobacteria bacterium]MYC99050.1 PLP-dependent transferase [Gammaproteobacteria bacterium]
MKSVSEERTNDSPKAREAWGPGTLGVHAGGPEPRPGEPVVLPVVQSSTFFWNAPGDAPELRYSRYGNNPNQVAVAKKLAALEGTEASLAVASGMAATALPVLALTRAGDHVVASKHLYGATSTFLADEMPHRGVTTTFVDPDETCAWESAMRDNTRILFLETPTNPVMRVFDPRIPVRLARQAGAVTMMDATFASPINLRPARLGVDIVIHSATKYLGGHSDLIAGVVSGSRELIERVQRMLVLYGPALDPHAAWLLERGIKTLSVRMARHNRSGLELAAWLEGRPGVSRVSYPGLASHPDRALAGELLDGFGGMVAFVLESGGAGADAFCRNLEVARVAPSLGGVETLVSQPRFTSHIGLTPEERTQAGIPDGFVRVSVGLEEVRDLQRDFSRALEASR